MLSGKKRNRIFRAKYHVCELKISIQNNFNYTPNTLHGIYMEGKVTGVWIRSKKEAREI